MSIILFFHNIISVNTKYHTKNHCKYLVKLHIVLCVKYRKPLLEKEIDEDIKQWLMDVCQQNEVIINMMESDKDHIHLLVDIPHTFRISDLIKALKQQTSWNVWKKYPHILQQHFWKHRVFWSEGHFVCSTGDVSTETILEYIRTQG